MRDPKICRICLRTEAKVYKFEQYQLKSYYEEVMALKVNDNDNLPPYFCYECAVMLHKFHKFKEKCYCGQKILKELLWRGPISCESVYKIDRIGKGLQSPVGTMTLTERMKSYVLAEKEMEIITADIIEDIKTPKTELVYIGNGIDGDTEMNTDNERAKQNTNTNEVVKELYDNPIDRSLSPETVFVDVKNESVKLIPEKFKERRSKKKTYTNWGPHNEISRYHSISRRKTKVLDANFWKKHHLSEEEALREFRERAEKTRYLNAAHKCTDCLKGFSKEDMLERHKALRHIESLGPHECRFCHMRFKWESPLRVHMRQHFTKYECLRCPLVCELESTAMFHEEYHSGITRKCIHCGEVFRHQSTYYTHLRTAHRSEHVCPKCGVSFVSELGLHNHKIIKHVKDDIDSGDDEDDLDTYCERCDIRFETRRAYEEHVFHSVLHSEGVENEIKSEIDIPRKVLGKRLQTKITKQLSKRKPDEPFPWVDKKQFKRKIKRQRTKPTTCYQCGKHFDTQAACMKHHQEEHPRTSFTPPTQRHICEICGASLAPGSVATHQNMHTRETIYSCDQCGKQFHSKVGLKRHLVCHSGEKPFGCPACDKRFTQNNSMKLHYRTFHLKQPYPKRNRRKKNEETQDQIEENSNNCEEESNDSLPEPEVNSVPEADVIMPEVPSVVITDNVSVETVHYLTLN